VDAASGVDKFRDCHEIVRYVFDQECSLCCVR
jgi:hypothetical protein